MSSFTLRPSLVLCAMTGALFAAAPASADERGFLALFEGQTEATQATVDPTTLARESPETTRS